MKKTIAIILALLLAFGCLAACGSSAAPVSSAPAAETQTPSETQTPAPTAEPVPTTVVFTDSCGREVELPAEIDRVAPSGAVATMLLAIIAPEQLVCVSGAINEDQSKYMAECLQGLPETGQLYGSKSTINLEELLAAEPQVIIDLGDYKDGVAEDMDALQQQTGIPTIFIEANLEHMAAAYRSLGGLLSGKTERGEEIAAFIDKTMTMAAENSAKIAEEDRLSVMYTSGADGLGTNAEGSSQAQVIGLVGATNAIVLEEVTNKGGGNIINMEQLYNFDPDVIIFSADSLYPTVADDATWKQLSAIQSGAYYEIPNMPYNWMSNPPSVNMVFGIWWLGNLLYPEIYDYDMVATAQEMFGVFWQYDMSAEEATEMLANSTLK